MANVVNEDLINTYKNDDKIISDFYKIKKDGVLVDVTGIINPARIDNRQLMSPTDNQAEYSACAGFSAATLVESIYWKRTGILKQLDSLQVYQLSKLLDNSRDEDGTYLEFACQAVLELAKKDPDFDFLKDAKVGLFYNDGTQKTIENVKHLIHKYDFLQVGFYIDEGWYDCNEKNYVLKQKGNAIGGHAVNLCFFDSEHFGILNQWGKNWGAKGYALIDYKQFLKQFMYGAYIYGYSV